MAASHPFTVRDSVHGNMPFTDLEHRIIDTLPFQRLRGLKQSSLANYTYPTALTTRFEHSLVGKQEPSIVSLDVDLDVVVVPVEVGGCDLGDSVGMSVLTHRDFLVAHGIAL